MSIFGKSLYEKALEEREVLLSYIETECTKGTDPHRISVYVKEKLTGKEAKPIFGLYQKEALAICAIPEKYNRLTKYIFLRSLYEVASMLFSLEARENREYFFCIYVNNIFIDVINDFAYESDCNKQYKESEKYLAEALAVAKEKSGSPARAAGILGNLGRCVWLAGRKEDGLSKLREAIGSLEKILGNGGDDTYLSKENIRTNIEAYKQLLVNLEN
jgi:tetratricopeptide (TPR) repeat protein